MHFNLSLKNQLRSVIAITVIPLCIFSGMLVKHEYRQATRSAAIPPSLNYTRYLQDLAHELQKERGMSAGFIASKGKVFQSELASQRKLTTEVIGEMNSDSELSENGTLANTELVNRLRASVAEVAKLRSSVNSLGDPKHILPGYTAIIRETLDQAKTLLKEIDADSVASSLIAANSLAQAKELGGLERARVSQALSGQTIDQTLKYQIVSLQRGQQEHLMMCRALLDQASATLVDQIQAGQASQKATAISQQVLTCETAAETGFTPDQWWAAQTAKLNSYREIQNAISQKISDRAADQVVKSRRSAYLLGIAVVVLLLVTMSLGTWMTISIHRRTQQLEHAITRIATGEADLSERLEEGTDELGRICTSFNRVLARLSEAGDFCGRSSEKLASQSTQVSSTAEQIARRISISQSHSESVVQESNEMFRSLGETSTVIEGVSNSLSSASTSVTKLASEMQEASSRANDAAERSESATQLVERNARKIAELSEAAIEISNVVELIQEIADQTNLLALNATIEAARAGEAGKGFAVVASEVKDLASQTGSGVESIRERIASIQSVSEEAKQSIEDIMAAFSGLREATGELAVVASSQGTQAGDLNQTIRNLSETSRQAKTTMDRSVTMSGQVSERILAIKNALTESVSDVEDTNASGKELLKMATDMQVQMDRMLNRCPKEKAAELANAAGV